MAIHTTWNFGATVEIKDEDLLQQFHQVVMRCETVGDRVLGMVCDAGGNNVRPYKLLAGHLSLLEGGWLEIEYVQVKPHGTSKDTFACFTAQHRI